MKLQENINEDFKTPLANPWRDANRYGEHGMDFAGLWQSQPACLRSFHSTLRCCLAKSDARLESIEGLLDEDADREHTPGVSQDERRWLESMIQTARDGDWESAAKSARRMMEDQVEY